jgi:hypothetical protein
MVNADIDFCKLNDVSANPLITTFFPLVGKELKNKFHACPYTVSGAFDKC